MRPYCNGDGRPGLRQKLCSGARRECQHEYQIQTAHTQPAAVSPGAYRALALECIDQLKAHDVAPRLLTEVMRRIITPDICYAEACGLFRFGCGCWVLSTWLVYGAYSYSFFSAKARRQRLKLTLPAKGPMNEGEGLDTT